MKILLSTFTILIIHFILFTQTVLAQSAIDTTVDLDVLTIPNSPAFNLLGISPSDVDKPATPTDFSISLANATSNFTQLPANYSIEFLPISFFPKDKLSYKKFTNNPDSTEQLKWAEKLSNNFTQTFMISSGISTNDSVDTSTPDFIKTKSGIGIKFSLVRGKIDTACTAYKDSIAVIRRTLDIIHEEAGRLKDSIKENDSTYILSVIQQQQIIDELIRNQNDSSINDSIRAIRRNLFQKSLSLILHDRETYVDLKVQELVTNKNTLLLEKSRLLKKQIENIKFNRYGLLLDFAGGLVLGFKNGDFQNSVVQKYAFWFNGGYSFQKNISILGLARYSTDIDIGIDENGKKKNENTIDLGAKLELITTDEKFSINAELIDRIYSDTSITRYTFNLSYQVGKNQALTFSIGKAFEGKAQTGGNLIAALNYMRNFGSTRKIAH